MGRMNRFPQSKIAETQSHFILLILFIPVALLGWPSLLGCLTTIRGWFLPSDQLMSTILPGLSAYDERHHRSGAGDERDRVVGRGGRS